MGNFFDRFRDLDHYRAQAEKLLEQGLQEGRRQAAIVKLKARLFDLDRRLNAEFRVLGEKVWELRQAEALTPTSLTGAFDVLEALAREIDDARDELQELLATASAPADEETDATPGEES